MNRGLAALIARIARIAVIARITRIALIARIARIARIAVIARITRIALIALIALIAMSALGPLACGGKHKSTPPAPAPPLTPANVQLTLLNAVTAAALAEPLTFFATVSYGATGTMTFLDGATALGSATVGGTASSWGASYTTDTLAIGPHAISAQYSGDSQYAAGTSAPPWNLVVVPTTAPASFTVTSPGPSTLGQSVTFTATLTYPNTVAAQITGLGTVTFSEGALVLQAGTAITNGTAPCTVTYLAVGSHTITAVYTPMIGTATYSTSVIQVVNPAA